VDRLEGIVRRYKQNEPIYVARPTMPPLERFTASLEEIWRSRWLTNAGAFHQRFEAALGQYLGTEHVNLFCNGTIALLVALQSLRITGGEVITTPFTFPATPHAIHWNGAVPIFCDIDPETFNVDVARIEALITPRTVAILPVHVFGNPCDVEAIAAIADRYGLRVIYDAAHAFGVRIRGRSVATFGDVTMLSFHATKLFTTVEGGALVSGTDRLKTRIDFLKNFGIASEEEVVGPGINGKMNELQSAFGLIQLEMIDAEIAARRKLVQLYRERLADVPGMKLPSSQPGVDHNHSYFPVLVDQRQFGMSRDELYAVLRRCEIYARKYFHPLCSHISTYRGLPSASAAQLPVAERVAREVLCLPIFGTLAPDVVVRICDLLHELAGG
jgi:dTDP-4-amino-4,6-dideoxygalactose transaminase